MEIKINDVAIDYRLEQESTVGEVYQEIESWLRDNGHRVLACFLDGVSIQDDGGWTDRPVDSVAAMSLTAENLRQRQIDDLETIHNYLGLLERVLRDGNRDQLVSVLEELPYVAEGIERRAADLSGALEDTLPGPLHDAIAHAEGVEQIDRAHAADRIALLDRLVDQRQRELLDPDHEMRSVCTVLSSLIDNVEQVPVLLQSGGEKEALTTVGAFSETVSTFLRILPLVTLAHPDLASTAESIPEINDFLREIEGALSNSDLVLLGDLLEYEIVPRFRDLVTRVRIVLGETFED